MDLPLFDKIDRVNGNHLLNKMVRGCPLLKGFPSWSARGVFKWVYTFPLLQHIGNALDLGPMGLGFA